MVFLIKRLNTLSGLCHVIVFDCFSFSLALIYDLICCIYEPLTSEISYECTECSQMSLYLGERYLKYMLADC